MNILKMLFGPFIEAVNTTKDALDEDAGYTDHMVGQKTGPYYCGTAFCGHSTKKAARECWRKKVDAIDKISEESNALREAGKYEAADLADRRRDAYYPELNPANWPINRNSYDMQAEYKERAKLEEKR